MSILEREKVKVLVTPTVYCKCFSSIFLVFRQNPDRVIGCCMNEKCGNFGKQFVVPMEEREVELDSLQEERTKIL